MWQLALWWRSCRSRATCRLCPCDSNQLRQGRRVGKRGVGRSPCCTEAFTASAAAEPPRTRTEGSGAAPHRPTATHGQNVVCRRRCAGQSVSLCRRTLPQLDRQRAVSAGAATRCRPPTADTAPLHTPDCPETALPCPMLALAARPPPAATRARCPAHSEPPSRGRVAHSAVPVPCASFPPLAAPPSPHSHTPAPPRHDIKAWRLCPCTTPLRLIA